MSDTTNEPVFHYTLHKKLWNILADNPGMNKRKALDKFFTEEERKEFGGFGCTACTYAILRSNSDDTNSCSYCPLDDNNVQVDPFMDMAGQCFKGLFGMWDITTALLILKGDVTSLAQELSDYDSDELSSIVDNIGPVYDERRVKEICSKYAKAIADLPVKAGVKYI